MMAGNRGEAAAFGSKCWPGGRWTLRRPLHVSKQVHTSAHNADAPSQLRRMQSDACGAEGKAQASQACTACPKPKRTNRLAQHAQSPNGQTGLHSMPKRTCCPKPKRTNRLAQHAQSPNGQTRANVKGDRTSLG